MKESHGFKWPDRDTICAELLTTEVEHMAQALEYCKHFRTAVQAGGNVGVYPKWLSSRFEVVHTFEPDLENFTLLLENTEGIDSIIATKAALGHRHGRIGLNQDDTNCGGSYITQGVNTQMLMLDDVPGIQDVDLIQLDVEGYEKYALLGAEGTVKRDKPVIVVEDRGHGDLYDVQNLVGFIERFFGYEKVLNIDHDVVLVPATR